MHMQTREEIRETPSTSGQEQGQGKHVGAVGRDDEVEDGWLLLEKKAGGVKKKGKEGGRKKGNRSHTGLANAPAEPRLCCRWWWDDSWSVVGWSGGRMGVGWGASPSPPAGHPTRRLSGRTERTEDVVELSERRAGAAAAALHSATPTQVGPPPHHHPHTSSSSPSLWASAES